MNSSGEMTPRSGCGQRISTSMPSIRPSLRRTFGWKCASRPPACDRVVQVRRELQALRGMRILRGVVEPVALARVLGAVHRDVGAAQQRAGVVAVGGVPGDADARADLEHALAAPERLLDGGGELLGERDDRRLVRELGQQDDELVTAEARDRVALAQRVDEARRRPTAGPRRPRDARACR